MTGSWHSRSTRARSGVGQPTERVQEVLASAYLPTEQVRLAINVLLVRTKTDLILVDTGCGAAFGDVGGRLVGNLAAAGVRPEQVTVVVLTHLHGDHFGGLADPATNEPVFKNARFVLFRREHDFWMNSPDLAASKLPPEVRAQFVQSAQAAVNALKGKWELVAPQDRVLEGVEFLAAPGHTPGHLAIAFTSGSEQLINLADVAHHSAISFAHPEWPLAFDTDPQQASETRRSFFDRAATDRARVFGVHLPFPGLGHIHSDGGRYAFVPEPWQPV